MTPEERFLSKIEKSPDGCWIWTAYRGRNGYGRFSLTHSRAPLAHRYSYEMHVGPIPSGYQIDHLCRVRWCVNPEHLEAVTPRENVMRSEGVAAHNARRVKCAKCGGPFSEFYRQRRCLACRARYVSEVAIPKQRQQNRDRRAAAS